MSEGVFVLAKNKNKSSAAIKIKDAVLEKAPSLEGRIDLLGKSSMSFPVHMSGPRTVMFTGNLDHFRNLKNPDFPKVFTNMENTVGKNSTGFYDVRGGKKTVHAIIPRFKDGKLDKHLFDIVLYDEEKDEYDYVQKKTMEVLTEGFAFSYNTDVMDNLKVDDVVENGTKLYKSNSYDEEDNYQYGKNLTFSYFIDNDTIEDAIKVSESAMKALTSTNVETVEIPINDNDILAGIYSKGGEYKCFPDIGEEIVESVLCARRRIQDRQLLSTMKHSNLRTLNSTYDTPFYCEGEVMDIFIYNNKPIEEIPDNMFNAQILKYLRMQNEYFQTIKNVCEEIIESGSKYTSDLSFMYDRANKILNPDVKWRDEKNSVFSNLRVEITVKREYMSVEGQKLTGRMGNKGVISRVCKDEDMPITDDGRRVDIMLNALGPLNRLNVMQWFELSITSSSYQTIEYMATLDKQEEREEILVKYIRNFNSKQADEVQEYLDTCSDEDYVQFFNDVFGEPGIKIHIEPMWHDEPLIDKIARSYDEMPWLRQTDLYVKKFGRMVKVMNKFVVGEMYIMKLKQTAEYGLSARSTGPISRRGLPEKTRRLRDHKDLYSKTPIRKGFDENDTLAIGVPTDVLAVYDLLQRSSVIGRQSLPQLLATSTKPLVDVPVTEKFTNRNIEIFNAWSMVLGWKLTFEDEMDTITILRTQKSDHELPDGSIFHGTDEEYLAIMLRPKVEEELQRRMMKEKRFAIVPDHEYNQLMDQMIKVKLADMYRH